MGITRDPKYKSSELPWLDTKRSPEHSPSLNKLFKAYRSHVLKCIKTLKPIPTLEEFYFEGRQAGTIHSACRVLEQYMSQISRLNIK